MSILADRWPYLLLLAAMWVLLRWGKPLSAWVRDRRRPHPSIEQASHDRPDDLLEQGRRLASQRDDLIAEGADPSELEIPLAPPPVPGQEDK